MFLHEEGATKAKHLESIKVTVQPRALAPYTRGIKGSSTQRELMSRQTLLADLQIEFQQ